MPIENGLVEQDEQPDARDRTIAVLSLAGVGLVVISFVLFIVARIQFGKERLPLVTLLNISTLILGIASLVLYVGAIKRIRSQ